MKRAKKYSSLMPGYQLIRPVANKVWGDTFKGKNFCFHSMFKTNFSVRNTICRGTKNIWWGAAPVATGL